MGSSRSFVRVVYRRNSWQDAFREIAVSLHLQHCHCHRTGPRTHQASSRYHFSLLLRWQARTRSDASRQLEARACPSGHSGVEQDPPQSYLTQCLVEYRDVGEANAYRSREAAASFSSRSIPIIVVSLLLSMTAVKACMARHTCTRSVTHCAVPAVPRMGHCCHGQKTTESNAD